MNDNHINALNYIKNAGGHPLIEWFDEDNYPIGPMLRENLIKKGYATEYIDNEPCNHRGCRHHVNTPCEVCGRLGAKGSVILKALPSIIN